MVDGPGPVRQDRVAIRDSKLNQLSLSSRIFLVVAPLVTLMAVLLVVILGLQRQDDAQKRYDAEAQFLGSTYSALLTDYVVNLDTPQITPILRALASTRPANCASLAFEGLPQIFGWPTSKCAADPVAGRLFTTQLRHGDHVIAELTIRVDDQETRLSFWRTLGNDSFLLAAVMVTAAIAILLALRRYVAVPVRRLTGAMLTLSRGTTEFEIPFQQRHDEIGAMARALDVFRETKIVADRTASQLAEAQSELIEQAKFASLGSMVAGVAHELNTPIGICTTATSASADDVAETLKLLASENLTEKQLRRFLKRQTEGNDLVLKNLDRAARLIGSFKQVAVHQTLDLPRAIDLRDCLIDAVNTIKPELKKHGAKLDLSCPAGIELTTYPSAIWQLLSNLVMNSLIHGFDHAGGVISVTAGPVNGMIEIVYRDNGRGMEPDVARRIFEPFFTTKRGQGGTGLGMTIAYNLVTRVLGGRIASWSEPGKGVRFTITFPIAAQADASYEMTSALLAGPAEAEPG